MELPGDSRLRLGIWVSIALGVCLLFVGAKLNAGAHSALERSNPEADATVASIPKEIELFFTQEIDDSGTEIRVLGPDGSQVDNGDTTLDLNDLDRKRVTVTVRDGLPPGVYTVEWTTLSTEDGEVDSGSFSFTLQAVEASPVASPVASPSASPAATSQEAAA